ncbi:hypothetical protein BJ742DRAFT_899907 [Cladochytrium replicatum]|nr:hypothetical protein BJ742DRAFT_899907 [Cladochytrium replicatum]
MIEIRLSYLKIVHFRMRREDDLRSLTKSDVCELFVKPWTEEMDCPSATLQRACAFHLALTKNEEAKFLEPIRTSPGKLFEVLERVRSEESQAVVPADQENVHKIIRQTITSPKMDRRMFDVSRGWMFGVLERKVDSVVDKDNNDWKLPLAIIHMDQRNAAGAEAIFQEALKVQLRDLGQYHDHALVTTENLATGKYAQAEALNVACVEQNWRLYGEDHEDTIRSLSTLGGLYTARGRPGIVVRGSEKLIAICLAARSQAANIWYCLALAYQKNFKYEQAESLHRTCVYANRLNFGNDHPTTLRVLNSVAAFGSSRERTSKLNSCTSRVWNPSAVFWVHPSTLRTAASLSLVHQSQGKIDEAEPLLLSAVQIQRETLGESHPDTLRAAVTRLATLYYQQENSILLNRSWYRPLKPSDEFWNQGIPNQLQPLASCQRCTEHWARWEVSSASD